MNYVKNLIKVLLLAQCLLFCVCDKKEIKTTEQNILNLADFVKCPFNEEFKNNTNLEKYVLKKFGKPDVFGKGRTSLGDAANAYIIIDEIWLEYLKKDPDDKYSSFIVYRGVSKRFEVFSKIYIQNFIDLKYGINEETTMRDIENLFGRPILKGRPEEVQKRRQKGSRYGYTGSYYYLYNEDPYVYHLDFEFEKGKLDSIHIKVHVYGPGL